MFKNNVTSPITLKKALLSFLLLFSVALLAACGDSSASNSPENTAKAFYSAIEQNQVDKVVSLVYVPEKYRTSSDDKAQVQTKLTMLTQQAHSSIKKHNGIKSITISNVEYSDDKKHATVTLDIVYKDGEKDTDHVKVINDKDKWMIHL